ncbi:macrolide family glycosyltransferase [Paenibacillus sp. NFR01]|uniref:macrolide family glycosyltransferase n=1 Tax=Paenibacillus sp. NFR01 TaxID=1566279 RepID=UPI0008D62E35|nr:macrolide family glycosyltransferase [Paenibacillus sp. NFR01]SEU02263.1 glycosyltransferase, MGT family [Paenibacillus sp. NFR01]
MARVLFVNAGSEGHVNPTVGVVAELISRGEEVVYFTIPAYRERMEQAGAVVRTIDEDRFIQAFIAGGRRYALERINGLLRTAEVVIPGVLEQIAGEHFDYLIHDSMFGCGYLLAQILKLPAICSCTSFAQTEPEFRRMLEGSFQDAPQEEADAVWAEYRRLVKQVESNYGVRFPSPYEVFCNPAPLTVVYTTRAFQPDGEAFGENYAFVGPSIGKRITQDQVDGAALHADNPIYISLGTVFNQAADFYRLCFAAFGGSGHTVVLAIGNKVQAADLGRIPDNFIVKSYVPQKEVLQQAKLFITHGGMNSVHEALYNGVPLVVLPQSADQPLIARRVAESGAGIELRMEGLSAADLRDAAERVLRSPSYRAAAAKVGETFWQAGGYAAAAEKMMAYSRQHPII